MQTIYHERLSCKVLINSPITIGFDRNPSIPHSSAFFLSSSKALAVMARIVIPASAGLSRARICLGGLISIHYRHLHIHQHQIIITWLRILNFLHCLCSIFCSINQKPYSLRISTAISLFSSLSSTSSMHLPLKSEPAFGRIEVLCLGLVLTDSSHQSISDI